MPSSPPLRWSDLPGARVGVWGLGVEGRANVAMLASLGVSPLLVDDRPSDDRPSDGKVLATASGGLEALARCEVVLKSPGISRYRPDVAALEAADVAVVGGLGLWLEGADRDRVLLVTGTKGKSTTASIACHLLEGLGERARVGGNLGTPPYDPAYAAEPPTFWVIEASSFQVTDLWSAPPAVAVTSLSPDHLDWHGGSEEHYFADKLALCRLPGARNVVANGEDALLRERLDDLGARVDWVARGEAERATWVGRLGLVGTHNSINAVVARHLLIVAGISRAEDDEAIAAAAEGFRPLPSRLEVVARCDGVEFVDDSLATNVLPTIVALDAFAGRRVALIAGGFDRGIDYGPLATYLWSRDVPCLVLGIPDNGPRILEAVSAAAPPAGGGAGGDPAAGAGAPRPAPPGTFECGGLDEAVRRGFHWAGDGGVVLLSPAAPSFGRFADYRDRSAAFLAAARSCCDRGLTGG